LEQFAISIGKLTLSPVEQIIVIVFGKVILGGFGVRSIDNSTLS